jgi:hypothetical protein
MRITGDTTPKFETSALFGGKARRQMLRKPRPAPVVLESRPIPAAFPPDSIWRNWEEGKPNLFRGNLFRRQGNQVSRVTDAQPPKRTER